MRPALTLTTWVATRACLTDAVLLGRQGDGHELRELLSDEMWSRIEPVLPDRTPRRGGRCIEHRAVVEAICCRFRTGSPGARPVGRFLFLADGLVAF